MNSLILIHVLVAIATHLEPLRSCLRLHLQTGMFRLACLPLMSSQIIAKSCAHHPEAQPN